ncbi:MAG: transketolase, partial [Candidatus Omnitrophota bacterium]|nr:transketolase [Candidatus Omnitrophota bacterium]
ALRDKAFQFRREILETLHSAGSGHPGGSLSSVEIFISLYFYKMNHRPNDPHWDGRDYCIVSKGHCTPVTYVTLANAGYFPKEELKTFRKFGTRLQGHVHVKTPGVEFNTGSLGHGLSVANGIAMGAKMLNKPNRVFCIMGDGEIQEGSVWEAAMSGSHFKLDNVCAIVDYNKVQENGPVNDIKNLEPLAARWKSFGWHAIEVDGHDLSALVKALDEFETVKGKPTVIIANTVKGKGVPFMEGKAAWHGKAPNAEQLKDALAQLQKV